jgi:hydrogenase maturation protease
MSEPCGTLVIGYGNTLRGDDGVGQRVAADVEGLHLSHVRTLAAYQLTPEIAVAASDADRIVFVDAIVGSPDHGIEIRDLRVSACEERAAEPLGHRVHPLFVLKLVEQLFNRRPEAYWVLVPVATFDSADCLSATAETGAAAAVAAIVALQSS